MPNINIFFNEQELEALEFRMKTVVKRPRAPTSSACISKAANKTMRS